MKKLIIAAMGVTAILASCSKNAEPNSTTDGNHDGPQVQITLKSDTETRAFFDDTAAAEAWESEIKTMCIYVFDQSGNIIVRRSLTASEVSTKSARFSLPNSAAGTQCSFYVSANEDYGDATSASALDNQIESVTLGEYNGSVNEVVTGRKRAAGFVMSGKNAATIAAQGSTTNVGVTLKRLVAKIAVKATLADEFKANFNGGTVVITSATLSKANATSYSFAQAAIAKQSLFSHTQPSNAVDGYFGNQFYIYGNGAQANDSDKVMLTLEGYFDADGIESTTHDRSTVRYQVLLNGAGGGEIKANGYYRVDASIKGLSGDGVTVTFTVADWETPVTQNADLGI